MRVIIVFLISFGLGLTCGCAKRIVVVDSDVAFAMHQENREFVLDRPAAQTPALVTAAGWIRTPGGPVWALRRNDETLAAYWADGVAVTTARIGISKADRPLGVVRPTWDANAIRLHIDSPEGLSIVSDVFSRTEGVGGPPALSRSTQTILDVRGRYQATLRDQTGADVGWLRLRIGPYEQASRIFEAALPAGLSEPLAVAAVLSLADEIDWIEARTSNVYQGDKGPLIQSIPLR